MAIKVECQVPIYEVNGVAAPIIAGPMLVVRSAHTEAGRIELQVNAQRITVCVTDLIAAVRAATHGTEL